MTTLVFRNSKNDSSIQQVQIGAADIVATVSAGHSAWGWIGGLSGIASILRLTYNASEEKKREDLFEAIDPGLATCRILGQSGLDAVTVKGEPTFGDSAGSKLVGMTFCALAHTMKPQSAIDIFMEYFSTALFQKGLSMFPGSKEALHTFLIDNQQVILNGGTIHHLPEIFDRAISALGLKNTKKASSHPRHGSPLYAAETPLLNGFLRWLTRNVHEPYHTRSAHVTRLAACLKCIGYKISSIKVWDGTGQPPNDERSIVLVTGGASETDTLMESEFKSWSIDLITHYRWSTVGSMFWNAFVQESTCEAATFQQYFQEIDLNIGKNLTFRWACLDTSAEELQAFADWKLPRPASSRIATRLATIFFPECVDEIAMYYEVIAKEKYLKAAKGIGKLSSSKVPAANKDIQTFQVITASICLAVIGQLGGSGYRDMQHSTMIDLSTMDHLKWLCFEVDAILSGGCGCSRIICTIASMHCAMEFPVPKSLENENFYEYQSEDKSSDSLVVGWRTGKYAILPELLLRMEQPLESSVLNLRCVDEFVANLPTGRDGSIKCPRGLPPALEFSSTVLEDAVHEVTDVEQQRLSKNGEMPIVLGTPKLRAPDKPLYINLERPTLGSGDPEIVLCGRMNGESIGIIGIHDVLNTLALSWNDGQGNPQAICASERHEVTPRPGDQLPSNTVYNVPASVYAASSPRFPRDSLNKEPRYHVYVQVAENTPWTIFLAGQSSIWNRVTFGCPDCAANAGSNFVSTTSAGLRTLIAYK